MLSPEKIQELKSKYGKKLVSFEIDGETWIFRRPNRAEWRRVTDVIGEKRLSGGESKGPSASETFEELAFDCLLSHERTELNSLLEEEPSLGYQIGADLYSKGKGRELAEGKLL